MSRDPLPTLTTRQRAVLDVVVGYYRATHEPCSAALVARRVGLHHSTVQEHFLALHRKGWIRRPSPRAVPTRW